RLERRARRVDLSRDGDEAVLAAEAAIRVRCDEVHEHLAASVLWFETATLRAAGDRLQRLAVDGDLDRAHVVELERGLLKLRAEARQVALARNLDVPLQHDLRDTVHHHR